MWVLREIMLGYKGAGGGERKSRDVDVSGIVGYEFYESLDKVDGIANKESECAIFVLVKLLFNHVLQGECITHFDLLL